MEITNKKQFKKNVKYFYNIYYSSYMKKYLMLKYYIILKDKDNSEFKTIFNDRNKIMKMGKNPQYVFTTKKETKDKLKELNKHLKCYYCKELAIKFRPTTRIPICKEHSKKEYWGQKHNDKYIIK